jgi:hypothetical protein
MAALIDPVADLQGILVARHRQDGLGPGAATPVPSSVAAMVRSAPASAVAARPGGLRGRLRAVFGARSRPGPRGLTG